MRSLALLLSLQLGIAGATVVFRLLGHTVLPGGMFGATRIVELMLEDRRFGYRIPPNAESLRSWQRSLRCCDSVSGFTLTDSFLGGSTGARKVATALVGPDFFDAAELAPIAGRAFVDSDFERREPVALISLGMARTLFGSARGALGNTLTVEGVPLSIVGVLPGGPELQRSIGPGEQIQIVRPLDLGRQESLQVIARLRNGVSLAQARAELEAWSKAQPAAVTDSGNIHWIVLSSQDRLDSASRRILEASALGGLLLVLVTAVNVSHLVAAEGEGERRRVAIRWALGANRRHLLGWKVKRALILSLPAGIGATVLAEGSLRVLCAIFPESLRFLTGVRIDPGSLAFAIAASFLSIFLWGVLPAVLRRSADLTRALMEDPRFGRPSALGRVLGSFHIVSVVAASFILLVLSHLLAGTIFTLGRVDFGFKLDSLEAVKIDLPEWKYADPGRRTVFFSQLADRLAGLPGITSFTFATSIPPESGVFLGEVDLGGETGGKPAPNRIGLSSVGPRYFQTLGQEILAGRGFDEEDTRPGSTAVVISHSLARLVAQDPRLALGKRIRFGEESREVVGVAKDLDFPSLLNAQPVQAYFPLTRYRGSLSVLVRATDGTESVLRRAVLELDPDVAVEIGSVRSGLARSLAMTRFLMSLFLLLSVLVGGLALLGVYGTVNRFVTERRREIALRMAVGATRSKICGWTALRVFTKVLAGVSVGLLASYPAARLLAAQFHGVEPFSVLARVTAALLLLAATFIAGLEPAVRASRVEPSEILRDA